MEQARLKQLIGKYHKGILTNEERKELNDWFHGLNRDADDFDNWINEAGGEELLADDLYVNFKQKLGGEGNSSTRYKYKWLAAAASILLCVGIALVVVHNKSQTGGTVISKNYQKPILPGSNKAILTLSNGQQIVLSSKTNGHLAYQGGTTINRAPNGTVVYRATNNTIEADTAKIQYNTLTTPRGGQHTLTLADGTRVWLNAASSIKFPVAFTGAERKVEITGEVYFEVVHNAAKPFKVLAHGQLIEDIGTHFNVNAYSDETMIRTTLIEGKVRIVNNTNNAILLPGQQSSVLNNLPGAKIGVVNVDTALVMAWKNGLFKFHNANLAEVMRQLARWYNVRVILKGDVSDREFSGEITRDVNMADVFDILSYLKVNFRVQQEGSQVVIIVNPQ